MSEYILVSVAWPYANSQIHVGNLTGSTLPADIFARYHRLAGNQVAMVSGSDAHGAGMDIPGFLARPKFQLPHTR